MITLLPCSIIYAKRDHYVNLRSLAQCTFACPMQVRLPNVRSLPRAPSPALRISSASHRVAPIYGCVPCISCIVARSMHRCIKKKEIQEPWAKPYLQTNHRNHDSLPNAHFGRSYYKKRRHHREYFSRLNIQPIDGSG